MQNDLPKGSVSLHLYFPSYDSAYYLDVNKMWKEGKMQFHSICGVRNMIVSNDLVFYAQPEMFGMIIRRQQPEIFGLNG